MEEAEGLPEPPHGLKLKQSEAHEGGKRWL